MLSAVHQTWLESRRIDLEVADKYGIHTDQEKTRGLGLAFPYFRRGAKIKSKYRLPNKRFTQDDNCPHALWNEDVLRDETLAKYPLIITEGEMDALSAIQAGYIKAVSVDGGVKSNLDFLMEQHDLAEAIKKTRQFVLASDGDQAGQILFTELQRRLGAARCQFFVYPEGTKDLNDVLMKGGEQAVDHALRSSKPVPIKGVFKLSSYPPLDAPETYSCGFISLNTSLRLWHGEFLVLTGIPGYGKSRFLLALAHSAAQDHGYRITLCSPEMRIVPYVRDVLREQHVGKIVENITVEEKRAADAFIEEHFLFIDQDPKEEHEVADLDWIVGRGEDIVCRHGHRIFILDPWNQVEHKREKWETQADYQGRSIARLKRFARAWDTSVWVAAHPTKDVREKSGKVRKPTLYDIDGSAHWYNAADHGVIVHGNLETNVREIDVQKSRYRQGGKPGVGYVKMTTGKLVASVTSDEAKAQSEGDD